jgi:hypothetical protein
LTPAASIDLLAVHQLAGTFAQGYNQAFGAIVANHSGGLLPAILAHRACGRQSIATDLGV